MSRGSQTKRATRAKERARQRAREKQQPPRPNGPASPFTAEADRFFDSAFHRPRQPDPRPRGTTEILADARAGRPMLPILTEARSVEPAKFYADAEPVLVGWVRELYGSGWQPTELIRIARTRAKAAGADLVRFAVAAERASRHDPTLDDPQWIRQWTAAGLPRQLPGHGWAMTWARRVPDDALVSVLRLAAVLGRLPDLEQLLAPPPGVRVRRPLVGRSASAASANPILERVRALLAKAESTEHESEAMAFTAKAQQLMTKHAIEQAMVDEGGAAENSPGMIRVPLDPPYADAKALLLQTIAENTRCRALFLAELALSHVIGYSDDLEAVELLFTSLLVQAQRALAEASATAPAGARTRSQAFRSAFLLGFTGRIGERLEEVRRLAYAGTDAQGFLPVLRSRDTRIDEFMADRFARTTSERVRGGYDSAGYASGRMAGDAAALASGDLTAE
ncbi:DUF2786 domain-containing protein [Micropruina sp.]|uniref:DUF2786 domain-containing protein n=1 Tax=Micropruina sp. TaxID=2737536 RepID=UPI002623A156|nr:DUF2786 domain-containing protein [Micropruina sp.]